MLRIVNKEYIIAHSRLDEVREGSIDDELFTLYAESAEETMLNYIDRDLKEIFEIWGKIPAPLKHAVLLLFDNSVEFKSPVSVQSLYRVDYSFEALIKPYMKL